MPCDMPEKEDRAFLLCWLSRPNICDEAGWARVSAFILFSKQVMGINEAAKALKSATTAPHPCLILKNIVCGVSYWFAL